MKCDNCKQEVISVVLCDYCQSAICDDCKVLRTDLVLCPQCDEVTV